MKNKYTSEDGRIELSFIRIRHNYNIYVDGDLVGEVSVSLNKNLAISFNESFAFAPGTLQLIIETINKVQRDINVKQKHLQTLKEYNLWRQGDDNKSMPTPSDITSAMQWAIEKIENDDI